MFEYLYNIKKATTFDAAEILKAATQSFVSGKSEAFETIYNQLAPKLMAICKRYSNDNDEAKDLMQESFIKIYKNLNKVENNKQIESWAKRIAINTCIDYYRSAVKTEFLKIQDIDLVEEESVFVEKDILNYDIEIVFAAIQNMPTGYRIVLNLFVFDKKSHTEIAEILKITSSSSRSQLTKARKFLKSFLSNEK